MLYYSKRLTKRYNFCFISNSDFIPNLNPISNPNLTKFNRTQNDYNFSENQIDCMQIQLKDVNEKTIFTKLDRSQGVVLIKNAFKVNLQALVDLSQLCHDDYTPQQGKQFKNPNPNHSPNLNFLTLFLTGIAHDKHTESSPRSQRSIGKEELEKLIGPDILVILDSVMQSVNRNKVGKGKEFKDKHSKSIFKVLFNVPSICNLGNQGMHYDYRLSKKTNVCYMPYSALFAVMPNSCLDLKFSGKSRRLHLDVGDVLLFSACVEHSGLAYDHFNLRVFAYYPTKQYPAQDEVYWL